MKRSIFIFSILSLLTLQVVNAQIGKGSLLLGGTVGFSAEYREDIDDLFTLRLNTSLAQFFTNRFAGGGSIGVTYQENGENTRLVTNLLSTARYYFTGFESKLVFFGQGKIGLGLVKQELINRVPESEYGLQYSIGTGMSYFVIENAAVDILLAYNRIGGNIKIRGFGFNIGFQIFLNGKRMGRYRHF